MYMDWHFCASGNTNELACIDWIMGLLDPVVLYQTVIEINFLLWLQYVFYWISALFVCQNTGDKLLEQRINITFFYEIGGKCHDIYKILKQFYE